MKKRTILVILSNRLDRNHKVRFLEVDCDDKGNILKEHSLRAEPREARYDEVWENDEGKPDMSTCHRFKRKYGHRLQRKTVPASPNTQAAKPATKVRKART
jgi:hypothetical protein